MAEFAHLVSKYVIFAPTQMIQAVPYLFESSPKVILESCIVNYLWCTHRNWNLMQSEQSH